MKKFLTVLFAVVMLFSLTACGGNEDDVTTTPTVDFDGILEGYTIIVSEDASNELVSYMNSFRNTLINTLGISSISFDDDSEIPEIGKVRTDKEILIGFTNRDESADIDITAKDYVINMKTSRIVICGGSDKSTMEAMDYFIANYIDAESKTVTLELGEVYEYKYEYPTITIAGNDIKDYTISTSDEYIEDIKILRDAIFAMTGSNLTITTNPVDDDKVIKVDVDFQKYQSLYSVTASGATLTIGAPSQFGLQKAIEAFMIDAKIGADTMESITIPDKYSLVDTYVTNIKDIGDYKKVYLYGTTSKDATTYAVGEEVEFRVKILADDNIVGCDKFTYTLYHDGDTPNSTGTFSALAGELVIKTSLPVPGTVLLTVSASNGGNVVGKEITIGAVVGFEEIEAAKEAPADFEAFWRARLDELYAVDPCDATPPTATEIAAGVDPENYFHLKEITAEDVAYYLAENNNQRSYSLDNLNKGKVYEFFLKMPGEKPATGYIAIPNNAKEGSLSISIGVLGAGVYKAYMAGVSTNTINIAMNSHGLSNSLPQSEYEKLKSGALSNYGRNTSDFNDPATNYFTYMLLRNMQAIRYAMSLPEWNGKTITASGSSQGGFQSIAIAALGSLADMPITSISSVHPWVCDLSAKDLGRKTSSFGVSSTTTPNAAYFDTVNFASIIDSSITVNMEGAFADTSCPATGVTAAYNALNCPKSITYHQVRTHTQDLKQLDYIIEWTRSDK